MCLKQAQKSQKVSAIKNGSFDSPKLQYSAYFTGCFTLSLILSIDDVSHPRFGRF